MWFYWILHLCFMLGNAARIDKRVTVRNCGKNLFNQGRIVGGSHIREGFFPWMVTLHEKYDEEFHHVCGATILNNRWVVTAAHCITNPDEPEQHEIYVGLHRLSKKAAKTVKRHEISKIIVHEGYHKDQYENDIALLKTADHIDFGGSEGFVNGICLPRSNAIEPDVEAVVAGWGHTQQGGDTSDMLRAVIVPVIDAEECEEVYAAAQMNITETMLCAGSTGLDSCQADSGGPLVMWNMDGRATLYGIVSFGKGCGLPGYPGVYTKVSSYVDWIEDKIPSNYF